MSHLVEDHPEVFKYMQSDGFAVQIGEHNPFGKIPVDQACEETVNQTRRPQVGQKVSVSSPRL